LNELDIRLFRLLHGALSGSWTTPMAALSVVGGGWGALAVVPLLAAPRTRRFAQALAGVLAVTAVLVFVLKRTVGRVRPCACLEGIHARVWDAPTDFSFPSGHAAGSFAFAVFLALALVRTPSFGPRLARWTGAVALVVLAFGVGLSPVAHGVHIPGDVAAGAVLGATVQEASPVVSRASRSS
jgi:undecaprenyl-diphosphatase